MRKDFMRRGYARNFFRSVRSRTEHLRRWRHDQINARSNAMSIGMIVLIVLILALAGVIPTWPHSRSWGYAPSGAVGLVVVILLVMLVTGSI
jgi:hypothetical protein